MMGSLLRAGQRQHCWTCQQSRRLDLTPKALSSEAPPGAECLRYLCPRHPRCTWTAKQHPGQLAPQSRTAVGGPNSPGHTCGPQAHAHTAGSLCGGCPHRPQQAAPQLHATPCSLPPPFSPHCPDKSCTTINTITVISNHSQKQRYQSILPMYPQPTFNKDQQMASPMSFIYLSCLSVLEQGAGQFNMF